jgi:hypothetical protein
MGCYPEKETAMLRLIATAILGAFAMVAAAPTTYAGIALNGVTLNGPAAGGGLIAVRLMLPDGSELLLG